jgi:hypothetical protein
MNTAHPQQHPAARTFGLQEKEIADLRLAAQSPLWRYLLTGLFRPMFVPLIILAVAFIQIALDSDKQGAVLAIGFIFIFRIAFRTYDWFPRRRLGRQLGYS